MRSSTKRLAGVAAALVLVAGAGVAYGALRDDGTTIHACTLNANGSVRIIDPSLGADSIRGHCTAGETEVTWNQQGPTGQQGERGLQGEQGLPGNTDSTVRHINMWLQDGQTVTAPVVSGARQIGTLSLVCSAVTYTTANIDAGPAAHDSIAYYSPNVAGSPTWVRLDTTDHLTIPWTDPAAGNWIEMMIEAQQNASGMTLTTIHGYMQRFPDYSGCVYYFQMDTADVYAPTTYTPPYS